MSVQTPVEISFVQAAPTPAAEAEIRKGVSRLEAFEAGVVRYRVFVAAPLQPRSNGSTCYDVRVEVSVSGNNLSVRNPPRDGREPQALHAAVHDAFATMERWLEQWKAARSRD